MGIKESGQTGGERRFNLTPLGRPALQRPMIRVEFSRLRRGEILFGGVVEKSIELVELTVGDLVVFVRVAFGTPYG